MGATHKHRHQVYQPCHLARPRCRRLRALRRPARTRAVVGGSERRWKQRDDLAAEAHDPPNGGVGSRKQLLSTTTIGRIQTVLLQRTAQPEGRPQHASESAEGTAGPNRSRDLFQQPAFRSLAHSLARSRQPKGKTTMPLPGHLRGGLTPGPRFPSERSRARGRRGESEGKHRPYNHRRRYHLVTTSHGNSEALARHREGTGGGGGERG